jgi:hypothetical protein
MTNFFDFLIMFLLCFKSSTALTSLNILQATWVKLVHQSPLRYFCSLGLWNFWNLAKKSKKLAIFICNARFRAWTYRKTSSVKVVFEALRSMCSKFAAFLTKTVTYDNIRVAHSIMSPLLSCTSVAARMIKKFCLLIILWLQGQCVERVLEDFL